MIYFSERRKGRKKCEGCDFEINWIVNHIGKVTKNKCTPNYAERYDDQKTKKTHIYLKKYWKAN